MRINFVVHVYKDELYARRLLAQVRGYYPRSLCLVIADGEPPSADFADWAMSAGCHFVQGDRLKRRESGGLWIERFLRLGAMERPDVLIKLDADSYLHRPFRFFPEHFDLAGTLATHSSKKFVVVRGGCVAYSAVAIAKILNSGLLKDDLYKTDPRFFYRRYQDYLFPGEVLNGEAIASEDSIMGHIAECLRLKLTLWHDVHICWREPLPSAPAGYWAVTHPHREAVPPQEWLKLIEH